MTDEIRITRTETIGGVTHMIVRCNGYYAYVQRRGYQMQAPVYGGQGSYFAQGTGDKAIDAVALWCSYSTARKRFVQATEGDRMVAELRRCDPGAREDAWETLAL